MKYTFLLTKTTDINPKNIKRVFLGTNKNFFELLKKTEIYLYIQGSLFICIKKFSIRYTNILLQSQNLGISHENFDCCQ